jgi:hypothetical protein
MLIRLATRCLPDQSPVGSILHAATIIAGNIQGEAMRGQFRMSLDSIVGQADPPVVQELRERLPAFEHVIHRLRDIVVARELGAFLTHPALEFVDQGHAESLANGQTFNCRLTVDVALDIEQSVNATDRRQRHGRDKGRRLALRLGGEIGEDEEFPSGVTPTGACVIGPGSRVVSYSLP